MSLKLNGHLQSLCTQRVLLTLAEKGVKDFELVSVDFMTGEHKLPAYTEKHPFGLIPLLEDGDFKLFESRAIARYIATKFHGQGTPLTPAPGDVQSWALFEQWASVEQNFTAYADQILTQKLWNGFRGLPTIEAALEDSTTRLEAKLDILDTIVGTQRYMGGKEFSLIDIYYIPIVNMLYTAGMGFLFDKRPNLKAWWGSVSSRPTWTKILSS
ncbi:hypothetical protein ASPCAL08494 [Aspergillus calidoustus]|uniref:glutathione transferase n=1 Tax=Aspergillus calidoustus TaxID=454130 RepID=A0A0U5GQH0_ASPCI|nr:hypothetical protein ASPCAL08494 [Aspergillus calidoustus]